MPRQKKLISEHEVPWTVLPELKINTSLVVPGEIVKLKPTAPGKHDAYKARVLEIRQHPDETISVILYGGRGYPADSVGRLQIFEIWPDRIDKLVTVKARKDE